MEKLKHFGYAYTALLNLRHYKVLRAQGFSQFFKFFLVQGNVTVFAYSAFVISMFSHDAPITLGAAISLTVPIFWNVFLLSTTFCFIVSSVVFFLLYWVNTSLKRTVVNLREYVLMSCYSITIVTNFALAITSVMMYVIKTAFFS